MSTAAERRAAIDAMLAQRGRGRIGENDAVYDSTIAAALTPPESDRAAAMDALWAKRNAAVRASNDEMHAGMAQGLAVQQLYAQQDLQRAYDAWLEGVTPKPGRGGGGRSGGGGTATVGLMTSSAPSPTVKLPTVTDPKAPEYKGRQVDPIKAAADRWAGQAARYKLPAAPRPGKTPTRWS